MEAVADEQLTIARRLQRPTRAAEAAASIEVVYVRHYRSVFRYALGLTRSTDEAEDITAETFERAVRAWDARAPVNGAELPWLLLTARRLATDRWRRLRRSTALARQRGAAGMAGGHAAAHTPDAGEARTEFWLWFHALSDVLSPRQREALLLRYQRDLSDEDIGQVMGISASGVRSLVSRALEILRRHPELL